MARLSLALPVNYSAHASNPEWLTGSDEQQAIWEHITSSDAHTLVNAVAGSGKSTTCVEAAKRVSALPLGKRKQITYLAFNKHIQAEMENRTDGLMVAKTFHSLGLRAVTKALGAVKLDEKRMWGVIEHSRQWVQSDRWMIAGVKQLSSLAKQYGVIEPESLAVIADTHGLDLGTEAEQEATIQYTQAVLVSASKFPQGEVAHIDYDDMCWLPTQLDLPVERSGIVLADEAQDLNPVQQWLALKASERLVIVGDRNQAIYGFRGSDVNSMDNLAALAGVPGTVTRSVIEFPLTFTRRCPKSHVALAQKLVPHIHAMPDAIDGEVGIRSMREILDSAGPGEIILCRTNAPLIECAHKLFGLGKRATIKGRDIGAGIIRLLDQASQKYTSDLRKTLTTARTITDMEVARYSAMQGGKGEMRASMAEDRLQCLLIAATDCATIADLKRKLTSLFADYADPKTVTVLGSIHRMKGLEADHVTILRPDLLPHPRAVKAREVTQELNCLYVALTRSKRSLYFAGEIPSIVRS